jgi:hypothetical protein
LTLQIVPNGAAARSGQVWVGDILQTVDGHHTTSIVEAKELIIGTEGTIVTLGLFRPSLGEFIITIPRSSGTPSSNSSTSPPAASTNTASSNRTPKAGDYGAWSVKDLKQALSEAGVNHAWANEKSELVALASENKIPPPGTSRPSSSTSSGQGSTELII